MGHFEYVLLFSIVALGAGADGRAIRRELARRTGREVTPGAVYTVLQRLEDKGLVESWLGDESPARGGRRSRHYWILPAGAEALLDAHRRLQQASEGLLADVVRLAAAAEPR